LSRTLIIQSFRRTDIPDWMARCLASVQAWAQGRGYDYQLTGDEAFDLCGADYLARAGGNIRTITNLARLELVKLAHRAGYDRAVWVDADVFVFDAPAFQIDAVARYAFARETWITPRPPNHWHAVSAVNNCVFVCNTSEPDLDFLIAAIRHVAAHRQITDNFQVGGDLIKGLRRPLAFEMLDDVGMLSNHLVLAVARDVTELCAAQARLHGTPLHAANLCASPNHIPLVSDAEAQRAMDRLEGTRGGVLNGWLRGGDTLAEGEQVIFHGQGLEPRLA
jgi:hypothetical protein